MGGDHWPLVGRAPEMEAFALRVHTAGGFVIAGPAGVGKTRLALECLEAASAHGYVPLRVVAAKATSTLPLGAFAGVLPELDPRSRVDILYQAARAVADYGGGSPVALFVDDAHLLDDTSAALAHQVAAGGKALVIATVRSGELAPEPVVALWKDGLAERAELEPLGLEEVSQLVTAVLGGPVERPTARLLFERSGGNPLFLRELVLGALETGMLKERSGLWHLETAPPVSARLIELVETRLSGLSETDERALEILALGEPLSVEFFEMLAQGANLNALQRRRLIRVDPQGRRLMVRLDHPIYGEVLRALLSPVKARALRRSLADVLEQFGARRREDLLRLATWRLEGGGQVEPTMMLAAAREACTRHELVLAERLARVALETGGGFEAALLIAKILTLSGRPEQAHALLADLGREAVNDDQRSRLAHARMSTLCYNFGRLDEAIAVGLEAEGTISDPTRRDRVTAHRAWLQAISGQTAAAIAEATPLIERTSGLALAEVCGCASFGLTMVGAFSRALEMADRGLTAWRTSQHRAASWVGSLLLANQFYALHLGGSASEAETLASRAFEQAVDEGSLGAQCAAGALLSYASIAQGRVHTAIRFGSEAAIAAREHGQLLLLRNALIPLAEALALAGQAREAAGVLAELDALALRSVHIMDAEVTRVRAWVAVAQQDLATARDLLAQAAATAATSGDCVWESAALHDLARLGRAKQAAPRLAELATMIEGPLAGTRAAHAAALAADDATALASVSTTFEELGMVLLAAEAAADAGAAWHRCGQRRPAGAAQRRAHHLAMCSEGAKTPALAATATARATLTGRELEIAQLAAAGRSNKEIAQELFLSLHTVKNKLHATYEKLGAEGRDHLAHVLQS